MKFLTSGGIVGKVTKADAERLNVDIASNVNVVVVYRSTVADVLNKKIRFYVRDIKMEVILVLSICFLGIYYLIPNFYKKTEVTGLLIIFQKNK